MLSLKLSILILLIGSTISAQKVQKEIGIEQYAEIAIGNSYITFPTDLGNIEPLWFEGNIKPNFLIRTSDDAQLMGVLTPQIILRMYREESYPVRTPSYMPQVSAYYKTSSINNYAPIVMFRLAHHSNGQDGDFLLPTGEINKISGNFATNYIEFGFFKPYYSKLFDAHQIFSSTIEIHPHHWIMKELRSNYGRYRFKNTIKIFKLKDANKKNNQTPFSIEGELTLIAGRMASVESLSTKRIIGKLTLNYHPSFLKEVGFFVQLYHGTDYYNIYFDHVINTIRMGIMTTKLQF